MNSKEIELFAHFDDGDPAGILYFANYLRFTQRAFELSLAKESLSWKDWFDHPEWGIPLRHAESEYHRPLRPGQKCFVRQGVTRLGETSLTIKSEILDEQKNLCATVRTTHVFVDKKTLKKRPIPSHIRDFLKTKLIEQA